MEVTQSSRNGARLKKYDTLQEAGQANCALDVTMNYIFQKSTDVIYK